MLEGLQGLFILLFLLSAGVAIWLTIRGQRQTITRLIHERDH